LRESLVFFCDNCAADEKSLSLQTIILKHFVRRIFRRFIKPKNIFHSEIIGAFVLLGFILALAYSCANKGQGPQGGPRDVTPPVMLRSTPEPGAVNFTGRDVLIEFDENIQLISLVENLVVSPPQQRNPDVRAHGRRLRIRFQDDLLPNTTYTLNFGNAVADLNERNVLENFRFSFSTGDHIDSLRISGILINAEDLNPVSGVLVGIHEELGDSVFKQQPFLRIGRTDENGYFVIDGIREGTFSIFALEDRNRDFMFQTGEGLAMHDELITPFVRFVQHSDTIWTDSITIDTIHVSSFTYFYPNDIILRFFRENKVHQRLINSERTQPERFSLFFNTTLAELPKIEPLNFDWEDNYILQKNNSLDTLTYWLTNPMLWELDTLKMAVTYFRTDSIFQLELTTDTLNIPLRLARTTIPRTATRRATADTDTIVPERIPLTFQTNISAVMEVYNPLTIRLNEPAAEFDVSLIQLKQQVDTLFVPRKFEWVQTDSSRMKFSIKYDWTPEASYILNVDSAAFVSILGRTNNEFSGSFRIRSLSEYSNLTIILTNHDPRAVLQLLDARENLVRTLPAITNEVVFEHLRPGGYFLRLFIDENGNGIWDTGDFATRRQPEEVFYFPHRLNLRANFDFEEQWNHLEVPLLEQKPLEILQDINSRRR